MNEVLVWLLISVSTWGAGSGKATVIERFKTQQECQRVAKLIPLQHMMTTRCIQADTLIGK